VAVADDVPLSVHTETPSGDDFNWNGDYRVFETDAVKFQLQITLANEMSRFFIGFEVSCEVASAREDCVSELVQTPQLADNWVTNRGSCRGKTWLV